MADHIDLLSLPKGSLKLIRITNIKGMRTHGQLRHCSVVHGVDNSKHAAVSFSNSSYSKNMQDGLEKEKLLSIRSELLEEFQVIKDISQELSSFKVIDILQQDRPRALGRKPERSESRNSSAAYDKDVWPAPDPLPPRSVKKKPSIGNR